MYISLKYANDRALSNVLVKRKVLVIVWKTGLRKVFSKSCVLQEAERDNMVLAISNQDLLEIIERPLERRVRKMWFKIL
jgi:hypothetical protein